MKGSLLLTLLLCSIAFTFSEAQNVFDPNDPQIRYDGSKPLGSAQKPNPSVKGLQKWVSTPTSGISSGGGSWNNASFKAYYLNIVSSSGVSNAMSYRIKFPKSWGNPDSIGKKYPVALFFHGAGEVACPSNNGIYNNEKQLVHGGKTFSDRVDQNLFDGFLVYPQIYNASGCFGEWPNKTNAKYTNVLGMVDSLAKYARADIDRVFAYGLSSGGVASWAFAIYYPTRVATIAPSSAIAPTAVTNYDPFVHIPVWFASGGKDGAPSPGSAQTQLKKSQASGASIRYTLFPDLGHAIWNNHWAEPDFVPFMNASHKANPLIFFQRDAYCPGESFSAKLGITGGFNSYEWMRDGVLIARQAGTVKTILDPSAVVSFEGNNITVRSIGTYKVRFRRSSSSSGVWSAWSPIPAIIRSKPLTASPPIEVDGIKSKVLPAPDGSTSVLLKLADNYYRYEWYRATDTSLVSSVQKYNAAPGTYIGKIFEEFGCGTDYSAPFTVINAAGSPKPDPAKNLTGVAISKTSVQLDWTTNPNAGVPETGFEVYRSTTSGGPYTLLSITPPRVATYQDNNLPSTSQFYYIVRAVNNTGAAAISNEVAVKTVKDVNPPVAPSGLLYRGSTAESVDIRWKPATDDIGVVRYDVYGNNKKMLSTKNTFATVFGIESGQSFTFYVKAIDAAGNESPASNQIFAYTHNQGLNYKYYTGTWSSLPNFNSLTPIKSGVTDTVSSANDIRTTADGYGLLWQGAIYIPVTGTYTFETYSDDGSKLYIDVPYSSNATPVVNNDGSHSATYKSGTKTLTEGYHSIVITYFDATGGDAMQVLWTCAAAGISREPIPKNYFAAIAGPSISAPPIPTGLTAVSTSFDKIKLTWSDAGNAETGYEIVRSLTSAGTYIPAGNVKKDITQFIDSNLTDATNYYYKVRALSATGNSALSDPATAKTLALPQAPGIPGTPVVNVLGPNAIRITFDDNSTNETGFEIWRSMGNQSTFRKVVTLDASNGPQVTFTDNGLFANVTYFYKVKSIGTVTSSDFSAVGSGTTGNSAPTIAEIPSFTMRYGTTVTLPLAGTDADADHLRYSGVSLPSFASIQTNTDGTGSLVLSPSSANQGSFKLTVTVSDQLETASTSFDLIVNNNSVPVINAVAPIYMSEGETISTIVSASDVESQNTLTWSAGTLPSFVKFTSNNNGTATLLLQPSFAMSGVYNAQLKVQDPGGAWAITPVTITVYEKDPNEAIQVNFRNFTGGVKGWNDVQLQQTANASPPEPYFTATNLLNTVGGPTGVNLNVVRGIYKASQTGQVTGSDLGVYPDNIIRDQMNWGWGIGTNAEDTLILRVSNLSSTRKYKFTFFASYKLGSTTSVTTFKIGTASAATTYYQNTTNTSTISDVSPDANGQVIITMIGDRNTTRGGVLNAIVIEGNYEDALVPAKATNLSATAMANSGVQLKWTDRAYNETNYKVYRAINPGGPWTVINPIGDFRDTTSFLDINTAPFTTYYYYVAAINAVGEAAPSEIASAVTGNIAPRIIGLANIYVKTDGEIDRNFSVIDSPGEILSVSIPSLPSFIRLTSLGGNNYRLTATPSVDNIGQTPVTVVVSDDKGGVRRETIIVNVADKFTKSFFVNFGSIGKAAPMPWNNWLGAVGASTKISGILDEEQKPSSISLTSLAKWTGVFDLGMMTGNNSGVYSDSVLTSGIYYNSTSPMYFRYAGLDPDKKYNIVVMSSVNEGLPATVAYTVRSESDTLNASYNTNRTANINGLSPDSTGNIVLTMSKVGTASAIYVNAIVLEEYNPAISILNPANLDAQPVSRNAIALTWSDRSFNENAPDGFELQRATDSLFTTNVVTEILPGTRRTYTSVGLEANTRYWFRLRARSGNDLSEYSNRAKTVTPQSIVYVNFNYQLPNAASPWNNLAAAPTISDVFGNLKNQSGTNTGIQLALERTFNGEFTAGKTSGNDSGVAPDNVLASNFWLDNTQLSTIRVSGLNHSKRYRFGFVGSSSAQGWYKGNYTATYTISDRTVYLNSWENASKIVSIPNVVPDQNGEVLISFSTTEAALYGFNAGMVISAYDDPNGGPVVSGTRPLQAVQAGRSAIEETKELAPDSANIYPNPFLSELNVDFFNSSPANKVSIELYDITGKLALRKQFTSLSAGFNTIHLNTNGTGLKAGVYIFNLSINGKPMSTIKLLKINK